MRGPVLRGHLPIVVPQNVIHIVICLLQSNTGMFDITVFHGGRDPVEISINCLLHGSIIIIRTQIASERVPCFHDRWWSVCGWAWGLPRCSFAKNGVLKYVPVWSI